MIRMSKLADYAFILLAQMVGEDKTSWSASELSLRTTLPLPTVAKLMKQLAKAGVVTGQRGATGGYSLGAPAKAIPISRVIEAVDGPIALTDCVDGTEPDCAVQSLCPMHGGWNKINKAVRAALDSVYLSELVAGCTCRTASRQGTGASGD